MTDDSVNNKIVMEKKIPSKCQGQDIVTRPRQDGSGGSQNTKNYNNSRSSRRESPGNPNAPKTRPEAATGRKPAPQKSKISMDKRPRPRGSDSLQSVEEDGPQRGPERGSLQAPGSKKQNFNHLLNFHFAPRNNSQSSSWRSRHSPAGLNLRPKFNKEHFLQANCQFMVKSTGDYSAHNYNPDLLVNWDMIEQIYIRVVGEFPQCPICLGPPVAGKITRCGHIFCWPCLLHYLALSDKKCRKCPMCYEPVYKHELKSVVATLCEDVQIGEEIEMQLMFRKKGCFKAMPVMCESGPTYDWESVFGKLLVATPSEVKKIVLDREDRELAERYKEDEHCPEVCFVEQAIRELDTRRSNTVTITTEDQNLSMVLAAIHPPQGWLTSPSEASNQFSEADIIEKIVPSQNSNMPQEEVVTKNDNTNVGNDSVGGDEGDADSFYFYQAVQGQNIFLHPLNMAMLWKTFGPNPANLPQIIQFRVVEKEAVTMMEDMRKRLKFLQHLPITTNVQLVEVDLKPPVVPLNILSEFSQQLDARKKRRIQRARDERIRERRREEEEKKRMLNYPPCPKFEPTLDFPEYDYRDYEMAGTLLSPNDDGSINIPTTSSRGAYAGGGFSEAVGTSLNSEHQDEAAGYSISPTGMSFAQIVSQPSTTPTSSFATGGGIWGKPAAPSPQAKSIHSDSDADPEEYTSVPAYRMSVSDAIARAFANISITEEPELEQASQNNGSGKKKGRKNKGKVLFATGMQSFQ